MAYDPKQSIGYLITRTAKEVKRKLSRSLAEAGYEMGVEQWRMLMILHHSELKNQQEIADNMGLDKTSLTRLLNAMEDKGFIVRVEDQRDKRNKLIYPTNKGRELREEVMPVISGVVGELEEQLNEQELNICKKVLTDIINNLCEETEDNSCEDK